MHPAVKIFLGQLSYGGKVDGELKDDDQSVISVLARVYEKARNALEYRADHLVRRAAIERILKRLMVYEKNPTELAKLLLTELKWARYVSVTELEQVDEMKLAQTLERYINVPDTGVPREWLVGVASAQIEEMFNLNRDFGKFTYFAFQALKQKIKVPDPNLDLLIFLAVDKIYSQSDDQQQAYHVLQLAEGNVSETWRLVNLAKNHPQSNRLQKYVSNQTGALLLLRDIYFANPVEFGKLVLNEADFMQTAGKVLDRQLRLMGERISTAAVRSVIYVFLTKMVVAVAVEMPVEVWLFGSVAKWPLVANLLFPPALMWVVTRQISLPKGREKEKIISRTWQVVNNFEELAKEEDALYDRPAKTGSGWYAVFSVLYIAVFIATFGLIFYGLTKARFNFAAQLIFVFFLSVIAFFAHRIRLTAGIYRVKQQNGQKSSLWDMIWLPILTTGSKLSQGLSKLNFLAFAFDFILEAPFKVILGFLDSWVQFLGAKKEEVVG
ncbi:MAG: hypothetical protein UX80_C0009G0019 [Candidatus Amesbacteria bacterium GW2011_GWA2_47_11b]|uniref:Uncharacterized protein n=2 Tax=Candidatus Amesiibacteriota TaxID=1752730 RepID=A0A0G1RKG6_9BACT|nr:MAG: hypothetical protein UX80_C0009G0019 [Candidatus Amesbacteria bacterium GW2011_GWA2_47_11b]KKU83898.1 MAG: hypothetical protein UY11_C0011G0006 [Candidatus Amesbacteria bacterium GW2011_GWC2_47_8]